MSNKIDDGAGRVPWSTEGAARVRGLRKAITADLHDEPVDTDVAPLMGELLSRLEDLADAPTLSDLPAPPAPDPVDPPGPEREAALLDRAASRVRRAMSQLDAERSPRAKRMLERLDHHLRLRREIVARANDGRS